MGNKHITVISGLIASFLTVGETNRQERCTTRRWLITLIVTIIIAILTLVVSIVGIVVPVITTRQVQPDPISSGMAIPD